MEQLDQLLFLGSRSEPRWRSCLFDSLWAIVGAGFVTGIIYVLQLYPHISNISLLYLFIVWGLASTRGLYAALAASIIAFLSFDFFIVPPLYTLTINQPQEWLALIFFLATAIITGIVATELRQNIEDANRREQETRVLYQLMSATVREENVEHQLEIVARAIVEVFGPSGVRACAIFLPDTTGKLHPVGNMQQSEKQLQPPSDEEMMQRVVMAQGKTVDLHDVSLIPGTSPIYAPRAIISSTEKKNAVHRYIRLIPLEVAHKAVGVMRLFIEDDPRIPVGEKLLRIEREPVHGAMPTFFTSLRQYSAKLISTKHPLSYRQASFFEAFVDQTTAIIERARLRQESLQIEVLQRTDALRAALLSSVSHDLRTPLSSIKVAANSLQQKDVEWDEEARQSFAVTIEQEADRLNRLVGNLLDMSRIEGGALKPEKELYPFDELVHDVIGHMRFILQGRDVVINLPGNLPPVELDYLQMDQVLTNLIENAVRYTPSGSPIEIGAERSGDTIVVSIADNGPGIPLEDKERIFDKFYRVSGAHRKGTIGSGLGLAVCRGLVEAHGGRIWAENRQGGGAIFRFTLPVEKVEELTHE